MAFIKLEGLDEGWNYCQLTPQEPHKWLMHVDVRDRGPAKIILDIYFNPTLPEEQRASLDTKLVELRGIQAPIYEHNQLIGFKVSSIAQIQFILTKSGIPHDIQVAAMDKIRAVQELQRN